MSQESTGELPLILFKVNGLGLSKRHVSVRLSIEMIRAFHRACVPVEHQLLLLGAIMDVISADPTVEVVTTVERPLYSMNTFLGAARAIGLLSPPSGLRHETYVFLRDPTKSDPIAIAMYMADPSGW